jgi:hypothetical protein
MSKGETARTNYQTARAEITARIHARDQALVLYLTAIGTIFTLAIGTQVSSDVLLIVPYLALGASTIISQHNSVIGAIADFLVKDIGGFLTEIDEYAPQWESSNALFGYHVTMVWLRTVGHLMLLLTPSIAALIMSGDQANSEYWFIWWIGAISAGLSGVFVLLSHFLRRKIHRGRFGKSRDIPKSNKAEGSEDK